VTANLIERGYLPMRFRDAEGQLVTIAAGDA
jgi:hypothetical protein